MITACQNNIFIQNEIFTNTQPTNYYCTSFQHFTDLNERQNKDKNKVLIPLPLSAVAIVTYSAA